MYKVRVSGKASEAREERPFGWPNIKRWAKAHWALKRTLEGCISSLCVRVKVFLAEIVSVSLPKKFTFTMVVAQ